MLEFAPSTPHDRLAGQENWLDVRGVGHVERDVLRTTLRAPLQAFEDLVWCADEVKPVAVAAAPSSPQAGWAQSGGKHQVNEE